MGSEMCIRDRPCDDRCTEQGSGSLAGLNEVQKQTQAVHIVGCIVFFFLKSPKIKGWRQRELKIKEE